MSLAFVSSSAIDSCASALVFGLRSTFSIHRIRGLGMARRSCWAGARLSVAVVLLTTALNFASLTIKLFFTDGGPTVAGTNPAVVAVFARALTTFPQAHADTPNQTQLFRTLRTHQEGRVLWTMDKLWIMDKPRLPGRKCAQKALYQLNTALLCPSRRARLQLRQLRPKRTFTVSQCNFKGRTRCFLCKRK